MYLRGLSSLVSLSLSLSLVSQPHHVDSSLSLSIHKRRVVVSSAREEWSMKRDGDGDGAIVMSYVVA